MTSFLPKPDIESSLWIARPPEDIWEFISDFSNDAQWRGGVNSGKWVSDPPHGVGSTGLHIIEGIGDWPWITTGLEEPHTMAWKVTGGRFKGSQGAYRIEPEGNGSRFTIETKLRGSIVISLLRSFLKRMLKRQNAIDLNKLKTILEA